ncbi:DUF4249 domain-containing protein [Parabacteroides sp. OttesenSCG-928-G07]|nr:DUF4249 domain-containing protein [Parabacteroides sp. OttesenSCG-928-G21]MDL2277800.1 DUF4249 domain-containing protein [Parabacteroides sp. OttesenSCG-928-G07]
MKTIKKILCFAVLISSVLSSCIEEFVPRDVERVSGILIVDGHITNDESIITLRYSVGMQDTLIGNETIDHALVFVETDKGQKMQGVFQEKGKYVVPTGTLYSDTQYKLHILLDGQEYESTFLFPLYTVEIDTLYVTKEGRGEPVNVNLVTHGQEDDSKYYFWSYNEIWEYRAELFANAGYIGGEFMFFNLYTSNNSYYCWARNNSKSLIVGSTTKLSQNMMQKKIIEIPPNHDKLSMLYYISIQQKMIRKETYDYYQNLQNNVDLTGSIFSPIPAEIKGNISCINNSDIPVIGYIDVTTTTEKSLFVPTSGELYEPKISNCIYSVTDDPDSGYPIYIYI